MNDKTEHAITLLCLSGAVLVAAPVWSAPPEPPGNLRSTVYSTTAGEVFWDRATDDGIVIGYDITRDGEYLGLHDALSLFQNDLTPNTSNTYEITSVDNEGERSATLTTVLNTGGGSGVIGVPPNKPSLRYSVYSASAAELFWQRVGDDDLVIGYEIVRNDETLGSFDALSFFMDDLEPGLPYVFAVTAVDNDNNRSETATIEFSTDSGLTEGPGKPEPPANLTARVYSATAAELFWDRADKPGFVYEISRLGLGQKSTDGTSFFDDTLVPGIDSHTYTVVASDNTGLRSEPVSITIDTSAYSQIDEISHVSGINTSNYLEVLSTVFNVFNGSAFGFGQMILDAPQFSDTRYVGPPNIISPDPDGPPQVGPPEELICSNGGNALFTPIEFGLNEVSRGWGAEFDDCQDSVTLFDGQFRRLVDFSERRDSSSFLSVTTPERTTRFSGGMEWKFTAARGDTFSRFWRMNDLAYKITEGGQTQFELQNADTVLSIARPLFRRLAGGFKLHWLLSDGTAMNISVIGELQQEIADRVEANFDTVERYESGSLQINASDGSALMLEADNGYPDSSLIRLTTNGANESFTKDWSFLEPLQLHPLRLPYEN